MISPVWPRANSYNLWGEDSLFKDLGIYKRRPRTKKIRLIRDVEEEIFQDKEDMKSIS